MSDKTLIQWTDYTWSPWLGCRKVSPGCANCYITDTPPFKFRKIKHGAERVRTSESYWRQPLAWSRKAAQKPKMRCHKCGYMGQVNTICPTPDCNTFASEMNHVRPRVFPSLCDPFDPEVPQQWFNDFFRLILRTESLTWLLLTKRPEQIQKRMQEFERITDLRWDGFPDNVWLGVSVEDRKRGDERIPILLSIPATVRFLSVEPMLERIDLARLLIDYHGTAGTGGEWRKIDWVIVGGESGKDARPCGIGWVRSIVEQCNAAEVPVFVKQLGANILAQCKRWPTKHPKGGDPSEWPEDLRVREFPL